MLGDSSVGGRLQGHEYMYLGPPVPPRDASLSLVWAHYLLSSYFQLSCGIMCNEKEEAHKLQLMFVDRQSPLYYPLILSLL